MADLVWLLAELLLGAPVELGRGLMGPEDEPRPKPAPPAPRVAPRPRVAVTESTPAAQYVGPGYLACVAKGSRCLVCESSLELDAVACPACATLHHQDCWNYVGGCSTYGCRRSS